MPPSNTWNMDEYGKSGLIGIPENKSFKNVDDNCAGRPKWMLQYLHVEFQTIRSFNCLISLKNESSDIPRFQAQTLELVNSSSRLGGVQSPLSEDSASFC